MSPALITLFVAAFAFGTAEFVIAGILPDVAAGVGVSIPLAGILISGYAIGIAIGGPAIAMTTRRFSRRSLILWLSAIFTVGQALCALAPSFEFLLAARVIVSVVHGAYFGIAAIVATSLVPENKRGSAVALLLAGLTVSNILGVPGGTAIGQALGWRATFWAVGGLGLIATIAIALVLPRDAGRSAPTGSIFKELRALGNYKVSLSLIVMVLVMIGQYSLFTYIAPLLLEVTGLAPGLVPWVLLLYGVGSTIGVFIGGRLADWRLMPSLITILAIQCVVFTLLVPASTNPWLVTVGVLFWGGVNFAFGAPVQSRVLKAAANAPNLASALIPSVFNVGIAIGASLGGALLANGFGYQNLPLIGSVCLAAATAVAVLGYVLDRRQDALAAV